MGKWPLLDIQHWQLALLCITYWVAWFRQVGCWLYWFSCLFLRKTHRQPHAVKYLHRSGEDKVLHWFFPLRNVSPWRWRDWWVSTARPASDLKCNVCVFQGWSESACCISASATLGRPPCSLETPNDWHHERQAPNQEPTISILRANSFRQLLMMMKWIPISSMTDCSSPITDCGSCQTRWAWFHVNGGMWGTLKVLDPRGAARPPCMWLRYVQSLHLVSRLII